MDASHHLLSQRHSAASPLTGAAPRTSRCCFRALRPVCPVCSLTSDSIYTISPPQLPLTGDVYPGDGWGLQWISCFWTLHVSIDSTKRWTKVIFVCLFSTELKRNRCEWAVCLVTLSVSVIIIFFSTLIKVKKCKKTKKKNGLCLVFVVVSLWQYFVYTYMHWVAVMWLADKLVPRATPKLILTLLLSVVGETVSCFTSFFVFWLEQSQKLQKKTWKKQTKTLCHPYIVDNI